jgi:MFS family permease
MHATLLIGLLFQTSGLIGASFASKVWHLILAQGFCTGWGMGLLSQASFNLVTQWFSTHRSLANGIVAAGAGLGGLTYSLVANAAIQHVGLSWTFRLLAAVSFAVNSICVLLVRDKNKEIGVSQHAIDCSLFKRIEFIFILGYSTFSIIGYIVVLFSLPHYARYIGLTAKQGSTVGALFNLGQALGRPLIGYLSDSLGRINVAGAMTLLSGSLVVSIWIFAHNYSVSQVSMVKVPHIKSLDSRRLRSLWGLSSRYILGHYRPSLRRGLRSQSSPVCIFDYLVNACFSCFR